MLVGVKIAQLHMGFRERIIRGDRLFQKRLHHLEVQACVSHPLSLPQAHGVVVLGQRIAGFKLGITPKSRNDVLRLIRRTIVGLGKIEVTAAL
jgi:hypothetical protein